MKQMCHPGEFSYRTFTCAGCEREAGEVSAARLHGACVVLSRFMVWVWIEAETQWGYVGKEATRVEIECEREMWLAEAIKDGRLRLAWREE